MSLADPARQRALNALLGFTFFMVIGFTMVMPLVAIHFVNDIGLAAAAVGLALAVRQLAQQGLGLVGGMLADRFGARRLICLGVLLRAVGFASLAWAANLPLLFVAMLLSALGGALFETPYQAAIAALTTEQNRPRYYAISNWVSGVATTAGPLLGVALLRFNFQLVCLVAAACFALNFVLALLLLPPIAVEGDQRPLGYGLALVAGARPFVWLTALLMGYWFVAVQINISFPLLVEHLTGNRDYIGIMFALNAGMTVLLQYPLIRLLDRWLQPQHILVIGVLTMSAGVGSIALVQRIEALLACVAVFALGTLITRPTQQTLIAAMADERALGTFLGVSALALAIGGGGGNAIGGWLIDAARQWQQPALPWIVFCLVGVASGLGLLLLTRLYPHPTSNTAVAEAAADSPHAELKRT